MTPKPNQVFTATLEEACIPQLNKSIILSNNCLLPETMLKQTPSQADGFDVETETDLRIFGCDLVQNAGILLKLPQMAIATGQIYLQRFYYSKSFLRYPVETMAMGSIYLASKVEEQPRSILDVLNVFHHMKQIRAQKIITPLLIDNKYNAQKNEVIKAEARILKELGFCVHVKHPHKLLMVYFQFLTCEKNKKLTQTAWNYLNDAYRTDIFLRFNSETIACACIYLSARRIGLPLPNKPHWFSLFNVAEKNIREVASKIMQLYQRSKVKTDEIYKKIELIRTKYNKEKEIEKNRDHVKDKVKTDELYKKVELIRTNNTNEKEIGKNLDYVKEDNADKVKTCSTTPPLKNKFVKEEVEKYRENIEEKKDRIKKSFVKSKKSKEVNDKITLETPALKLHLKREYKDKKEKRSRSPNNGYKTYWSLDTELRNREIEGSNERQNNKTSRKDLKEKKERRSRSPNNGNRTYWSLDTELRNREIDSKARYSNKISCEGLARGYNDFRRSKYSRYDNNYKRRY